MYVCGPTVYGPPHLGHGRFSLVFDVLRRYLEWTGLEVRYVSNITDIDDNIIERGQARGPARPRRSRSSARRSGIRRWTRSASSGRPSIRTRRRTSTEMVALVEELVDRGQRLRDSDGVYFSVETVEDYGLLARPVARRHARQVAVTERSSARRSGHPVDFALWKKAKPGEPSWPSPWGAAGRAGTPSAS